VNNDTIEPCSTIASDYASNLYQNTYILYTFLFTGAGVKIFFKKCTGPGPVSTRNLLVLKNFLLVLNIGMEEIKNFEHKVNLPL
jgi:hypothetical protein